MSTKKGLGGSMPSKVSLGGSMSSKVSLGGSMSNKVCLGSSIHSLSSELHKSISLDDEARSSPQDTDPHKPEPESTGPHKFHTNEAATMALIHYLQKQLAYNNTRTEKVHFVFVLLLISTVFFMQSSWDQDLDSFHLMSAIKSNLAYKEFETIDQFTDFWVWTDLLATRLWDDDDADAISDVSEYTGLDRYQRAMLDGECKEGSKGDMGSCPLPNPFGPSQCIPPCAKKEGGTQKDSSLTMKANSGRRPALLPVGMVLFRQFRSMTKCDDGPTRGIITPQIRETLEQKYPWCAPAVGNTLSDLPYGPGGKWIPMKDLHERVYGQRISGTIHTMTDFDKAFAAPFYLNSSLSAVQEKLNSMKAGRWLDGFTQFIAIETLIYSQASGSFMHVAFVVETSSRGMVIPSMHALPFSYKHFGLQTWSSFFLLVCDIIVCLWTVKVFILAFIRDVGVVHAKATTGGVGQVSWQTVKKLNKNKTLLKYVREPIRPPGSSPRDGFNSPPLDPPSDSAPMSGSNIEKAEVLSSGSLDPEIKLATETANSRPKSFRKTRKSGRKEDASIVQEEDKEQDSAEQSSDSAALERVASSESAGAVRWFTDMFNNSDSSSEKPSPSPDKGSEKGKSGQGSSNSSPDQESEEVVQTITGVMRMMKHVPVTVAQPVLGGAATAFAKKASTSDKPKDPPPSSTHSSSPLLTPKSADRANPTPKASSPRPPLTSPGRSTDHPQGQLFNATPRTPRGSRVAAFSPRTGSQGLPPLRRASVDQSKGKSPRVTTNPSSDPYTSSQPTSIQGSPHETKSNWNVLVAVLRFMHPREPIRKIGVRKFLRLSFNWDNYLHGTVSALPLTVLVTITYTYRFQCWWLAYHTVQDNDFTDNQFYPHNGGNEAFYLFDRTMEYARTHETMLLYFAYTYWCFWLQLLIYVRYNSRLNALTETLREAAGQLLGMITIAFILQMGYTGWGYFLYGTQVEEFRSPVSALGTLQFFLLGVFEPTDDMYSLRPVMTVFYVGTYLLVCWLVILNLVVGVISTSFDAVQKTMQTPDWSMSSMFAEVKEFLTGTLDSSQNPMATMDSGTLELILGRVKKYSYDYIHKEVISAMVPDKVTPAQVNAMVQGARTEWAGRKHMNMDVERALSHIVARLEEMERVSEAQAKRMETRAGETHMDTKKILINSQKEMRNSYQGLKESVDSLTDSTRHTENFMDGMQTEFNTFTNEVHTIGEFVQSVVVEEKEHMLNRLTSLDNKRQADVQRLESIRRKASAIHDHVDKEMGNLQHQGNQHSKHLEQIATGHKQMVGKVQAVEGSIQGMRSELGGVVEVLDHDMRAIRHVGIGLKKRQTINQQLIKDEIGKLGERLGCPTRGHSREASGLTMREDRIFVWNGFKHGLPHEVMIYKHASFAKMMAHIGNLCHLIPTPNYLYTKEGRPVRTSAALKDNHNYVAIAGGSIFKKEQHVPSDLAHPKKPLPLNFARSNTTVIQTLTSDSEIEGQERGYSDYVSFTLPQSATLLIEDAGMDEGEDPKPCWSTANSPNSNISKWPPATIMSSSLAYSDIESEIVESTMDGFIVSTLTMDTDWQDKASASSNRSSNPDKDTDATNPNAPGPGPEKPKDVYTPDGPKVEEVTDDPPISEEVNHSWGCHALSTFDDTWLPRTISTAVSSDPGHEDVDQNGNGIVMHEPNPRPNPRPNHDHESIDQSGNGIVIHEPTQHLDVVQQIPVASLDGGSDNDAYKGGDGDEDEENNGHTKNVPSVRFSVHSLPRGKPPTIDMDLSIKSATSIFSSTSTSPNSLSISAESPRFFASSEPLSAKSTSIRIAPPYVALPTSPPNVRPHPLAGSLGTGPSKSSRQPSLYGVLFKDQPPHPPTGIPNKSPSTDTPNKRQMEPSPGRGVRASKSVRFTCWSGVEKHGTGTSVYMANIRTMEKLCEKCAVLCHITPPPKHLYTANGKIVKVLEDIEEGGRYLVLPRGMKFNKNLVPKSMHIPS